MGRLLNESAAGGRDGGRRGAGLRIRAEPRIAAAALASPEAPLEDVRRHYSTVGGLNERCYAVFRDRGGVAALEAAMGAVLGRIRAPSTKNTQEGEAS